MTRRIGLFLGGCLGLWLLTFYPGQLLGGEQALVYSLVAMGLCLVPSVATLAWASWADKQSSEQQLAMVLGGTGIRMAFVLGAGLVLFYGAPYFHQSSFWIWILVFYLGTLGLEMTLLVAGRSEKGIDQA